MNRAIALRRIPVRLRAEPKPKPTLEQRVAEAALAWRRARAAEVALRIERAACVCTAGGGWVSSTVQQQDGMEVSIQTQLPCWKRKRTQAVHIVLPDCEQPIEYEREGFVPIAEYCGGRLESYDLSARIRAQKAAVRALLGRLHRLLREYEGARG